MELSIVLVILGLLVGGVMAGQSLVRAAQLRSVHTDLGRYTTAVYTFRSKYFALPGDMLKATDFWTATNLVHADCITTPSTGTSTCNGNGDGNIGRLDAAHSQYYELFTFWKHLENAGLVGGSYSNIAASPVSIVAGGNVAAGRIPNSLFLAASHLQNFSNATYFTLTSPNFMMFRAASGGVLKAEEAWHIDMKMDDGKPGSGAVKTLKVAACATGTDDATAIYALTATNPVCQLIFLLR